jgi:hypothetical protein
MTIGFFHNIFLFRPGNSKGNPKYFNTNQGSLIKSGAIISRVSIKTKQKPAYSADFSYFYRKIHQSVPKWARKSPFFFKNPPENRPFSEKTAPEPTGFRSFDTGPGPYFGRNSYTRS